MQGTPFRPTKAVIVDLFPHTPHCELVVAFKRYREDFPKEENPSPKNVNSEFEKTQDAQKLLEESETITPPKYVKSQFDKTQDEGKLGEESKTIAPPNKMKSEFDKTLDEVLSVKSDTNSTS